MGHVDRHVDGHREGRASRPAFTAVLLDLDGTLIDSAPGITAALAWTLDRLGEPVPPPEQLLHWVGPPVLDSFRDFAGLPDARARAAVDLYRSRYRETGAAIAPLFPGAERMLRGLHAGGIPLSLATSKLEPTATAIVERLGVRDTLLETTGGEDGVRDTKAQVVAEAVRRLAARGVDVARPVLVGDRHHDVEGAAAGGVPTIFADWGYGTDAEAAGAWARAARPLDVLPLVGIPARHAGLPPKRG